MKTDTIPASLLSSAYLGKRIVYDYGNGPGSIVLESITHQHGEIVLLNEYADAVELASGTPVTVAR